MRYVHDFAHHTARAAVRIPSHHTIMARAFRARERRPQSRIRIAVLNHLRDATTAKGDHFVTGRLPSGAAIVLNLADRFHQGIYWAGTHEEASTALIRRVVKPGDVMLDVGANSGYFGMLCADLGAHVHAFEPNPALAALIQRTANPQVTLVPAAVSDETGMADLYISMNPANSGLSSIKKLDHLEGANLVRVPTITLDDYCSRHAIEPRVIKLDVEGHEAAAVAGMERLLTERIPEHLLVELVDRPGHADPAEVAARISDHGYEGFALDDDGAPAPLTADYLGGQENVYFRRA